MYGVRKQQKKNSINDCRYYTRIIYYLGASVFIRSFKIGDQWLAKDFLAQFVNNMTI